MRTNPSYFPLMFSNQLRAIMTWLLTMADKRFKDVYPDLHRAGQAIMSKLFSIEASEVTVLGVYDSLPQESIKVLVNRETVFTIICNDNYNYKHIPEFVKQIDDIDGYKHEKYFLTTSFALPDVIDEFLRYDFKIIERDIILNLLIQFENVNEIIKDYVNLLSSRSENDFRLVPYGNWSEGNYFSMLRFLQEEICDLSFPVTHDNTWVCEIKKPIAGSDIIISLVMGYKYYEIGFFAEAVHGEEVPELQLKQLQNTLGIEMTMADIPSWFIKLPKIKPGKRFKLASINHEWIFDMYYMAMGESFIDIDKTLERIKTCSHMIDVLSEVNLKHDTKHHTDYPTLDL